MEPKEIDMTQLNRKTVQGCNIAKGDMIYLPGGGVKGVVETVTLGRKWATARNADGKLLVEITTSDEIEVGRIELTETELAAKEAEREAARRQRSNESLQAWTNSRIEGLEATLVRQARNLAAGHTAYSAYGEMMVAQAEAGIAKEIQRVHEIGNSAGRNAEYWDSIAPIGEFDIMGAFEKWSEDQKEKFTSRYAVKALSRSTSVVSNLLDDVDAETRLVLIDKGRWGMWDL